MKDKLFIILCIVFAMSGNTGNYKSAEPENPVLKTNTVFNSYEDMSSPKFIHLITKYQLDKIFHGETDELA